MREILFRGKSRDTNKWVFGDFVSDACGISHEEYLNEYGDVGYIMTYVIPETVGQFTGLYDDTRWGDLTDTEKKNFYNSVKSEDGKSIKYEAVEKVEHLWNSRPIFEGDIVECISSDYVGEPKIDTIIVGDMTDYNTMVYLNCSNELRNIGNIHDNPELLKGGDENA